MHRFDYRALQEQAAELLRKQVFFVGGVEKSGTSWLQHLLDLHPEVSCGGESHFLESLLPELKNTLEKHNVSLLDKQKNPFLHQLGAAHPVLDADDFFYVAASAVSMFFLKQMRGRSVRAIGERSSENVRAFAMLARLFPGAKCIHIVRDPRDGAVSSYHHARWFAPPDRLSSMVPKSEYVRQYADFWTKMVGRGVEFGEGEPDRYFELRYEDLVEQTPPTLARVLRFLGVDDSPSVAEACARAASFEKLSGGRPRGQEDPQSFFRKGVVGDWKNHLDAETHDYVIAKSGALMRRFGYL